VAVSDDDNLSPAQWEATEPRQDRKGAAVGRGTMCRGDTWMELAAAYEPLVRRAEAGCTAFFYRAEGAE